MINTDIVAYDFFDTIVHRTCHQEEVLYEWSKKCSRFLKFQLSAIEIYNIRKGIEENCRKQGIEELSYEDLIMEVFNQINKCINLDVSKEDFLEYSYNTEIIIEEDKIYSDDKNIKRMKELFESGKKIIIISDFYMGESFFHRLLENIEINEIVSKVFVSSEYGKRKSTGNLYKVVCQKLNIQPQEITMIGDNFYSDYKIPKMLGINVIFAKHKNKKTIISKKDLTRIYKQTHKKIKTNPFNGYIAELLFFFDKLYKGIFSEEVTEVLFCSREGQMMKNLFDRYQEICWGDSIINSKYFYVSRKAVLIASLRDLEHEDFDLIFRQYKKLSVWDFMKNLGMKDEFVIEFCENNKIYKYDKITFDSNDKIMCLLKHNLEFRKNYDISRKTQKKNFLKYMEENYQSYKKKKIVLIDVGWKGTIQDCIQRIIPNQIQLKGYYLGLITKEYGCIDPKQKVGILFSDYPVKSLNFDILSYRYIFYERIFIADHGPVEGYCIDNNGTVIPKISEKESDLELYKYIKKYQDTLIEMFEQMLIYYRKICYTPSDLYKYMIDNALRKVCIDYPKIWKVEEESKKLVIENFGDISGHEESNIWRAKWRRIRKTPFAMTEFMVKITAKSHFLFFMPFVYFYCQTIYWKNLKKIKFDKGNQL